MLLLHVGSTCWCGRGLTAPKSQQKVYRYCGKTADWIWMQQLAVCVVSTDRHREVRLTGIKTIMLLQTGVFLPLRTWRIVPYDLSVCPSICPCVCVCDGQSCGGWVVQKRLNWSTQDLGENSREPKESCVRWSTYGRHLANTIEQSMWASISPIYTVSGKKWDQQCFRYNFGKYKHIVVILA